MFRVELARLSGRLDWDGHGSSEKGVADSPEKPSVGHLGMERWVEKRRGKVRSKAFQTEGRVPIVLSSTQWSTTKAAGNTCCLLPSSHHVLRLAFSNPQEWDIQFEPHLFREDIPWSLYLNSAPCFSSSSHQPALFFHITAHSSLAHTHFFTGTCGLQCGAMWAEFQLLPPLDMSS